MTWHAIVEAIRNAGDEDRFVIWEFDPQTTGKLGPDGGEGHKGYTEAEVRKRLAEGYGITGAAIEELIAKAKAR